MTFLPDCDGSVNRHLRHRLRSATGLGWKQARVAQELLGDANFHADRWARLGGY
jgi:hypothetical protein